MNVTFWGVRGSIATSGPEFARVGGNTTCVEVEAAGARLILDAGTGVRALGQRLLTEARALGRHVQASFLFSHLHWDHIQGFPFFGPAYLPQTELALYGPEHEDGSTLELALCRQMQPPTFPVPLGTLPSRRSFQTVAPGDELEIGPFRVRVQALSHPQGSLGYRIETRTRVLCFATDTEHPEDGGIDERLRALARNADLLVYDAQFTEAEYRGVDEAEPSRQGWGHSTPVAATRLAQAAGAKRLALVHHDPAHDDDLIDAIEHDARARFAACRAARQRDRIEL
jgi:phosphoribosyl 1,2-cyclic phosphodiesterase